MKIIKRVFWIAAPLLALFSYTVSAAPADTVLLDAARESAAIGGVMYGVTLDDSRDAAGQGLDAELVAAGFMNGYGQTDAHNAELARAWRFSGGGGVSFDTFAPFSETNPAFIRADVRTGSCDLVNVGHGAGMALSEGKAYHLSFWARGEGFRGKINALLQDRHGQALSAPVSIQMTGGTWRRYEAVLQAEKTDTGQLCLTADGEGAFALDGVSLLPADAFGEGEDWPYAKLRPDMVEALRALNPDFICFPGSRIVAGTESGAGRYVWKDSIGSRAERKGPVRPDGSVSETGVGFHEYLALCRELGAQPVPALYAGLPERLSYDEWPAQPGTSELAGYIRDALDLIAYCRENSQNTWGGVRAQNGRQDPFDLMYLRIGGRHEGNAYFQNFAAFKEAVLQAYPDMTLIATSGNEGSGEAFDYAWREMGLYHPEALTAEFWGEKTPGWLLAQAGRYDEYARGRNAGVLVESFSCAREKTLYGALCEAAFLTGLERNGDVVRMASYGSFDSLLTVREGELGFTPSYEMLRLFTGHTGTEGVFLEMPAGLFGTASRAEETFYIKLINPYETEREITLKLENVADLPRKADMTLLTGQPQSAEVTPVYIEQPVRRRQITLTLPAYSAAALTLLCQPTPAWMIWAGGIAALLLTAALILGLLIARAAFIRARRRKRRRTRAAAARRGKRRHRENA